MKEIAPDVLPQRKTSVGRWIIIVFGTVIAAAVLIRLSFVNFPGCGIEYKRSAAMAVIRDLQIAISYYHVDYNCYPLPSSVLYASDGKDISTRSRGPMLPMLIGNVNVPQNTIRMNPKDVSYVRLTKAQNGRSGTWQDGSELVLSDPWGEPYYIVLDINNDREIANPELGAGHSDPDYAELCRTSPPPKTLPLEILVYSSGPDRDPKTWEDNVCSWRSK